MADSQQAEDDAVGAVIASHIDLVAKLGELGSILAQRAEPLSAADLALLDQIGAGIAHCERAAAEARA
jgi:hypothetical protein